MLGSKCSRYLYTVLHSKLVVFNVYLWPLLQVGNREEPSRTKLWLLRLDRMLFQTEWWCGSNKHAFSQNGSMPCAERALNVDCRRRLFFNLILSGGEASKPYTHRYSSDWRSHLHQARERRDRLEHTTYMPRAPSMDCLWILYSSTAMSSLLRNKKSLTHPTMNQLAVKSVPLTK